MDAEPKGQSYTLNLSLCKRGYRLAGRSKAAPFLEKNGNPGQKDGSLPAPAGKSRRFGAQNDHRRENLTGLSHSGKGER